VAPISPETQRTDVELIAAHAAGDPRAFEELFHRYQRQLARLALRRTRSPEDAADAVQEAMLAVHNGAARFRRHAAVSTWLHRIVLNKCIDQLRRGEDVLTALTDADRVSASDVAAPVVTAVLVHRALATLPPEQRAAVVMGYPKPHRHDASREGSRRDPRSGGWCRSAPSSAPDSGITGRGTPTVSERAVVRVPAAGAASLSKVGTDTPIATAIAAIPMTTPAGRTPPRAGRAAWAG
jgi:RNA polymerase sigma factor (sigma-70 family)